MTTHGILLRRRCNWTLSVLGGVALGLTAVFRRGWSEYYLLALFLLTGLLLAMIAHDASRKRARWRRHWWVLMALFVAAASAKTMPYYRVFVGWLRRWDSGTGLPISSIILAAIILSVAAGVGYYFLSFLAALPQHLRTGFVTAGILFLFGEVVLEAVSRHYCVLYSSRSTPYAIADFFENLFSMAGLIFFIDRLMLVLGADGSRRRIPSPGQISAERIGRLSIR